MLKRGTLQNVFLSIDKDIDEDTAQGHHSLPFLTFPMAWMLSREVHSCK